MAWRSTMCAASLFGIEVRNPQATHPQRLRLALTAGSPPRSGEGGGGGIGGKGRDAPPAGPRVPRPAPAGGRAQQQSRETENMFRPPGENSARSRPPPKATGPRRATGPLRDPTTTPPNAFFSVWEFSMGSSLWRILLTYSLERAHVRARIMRPRDTRPRRARGKHSPHEASTLPVGQATCPVGRALAPRVRAHGASGIVTGFPPYPRNSKRPPVPSGPPETRSGPWGSRAFLRAP